MQCVSIEAKQIVIPRFSYTFMRDWLKANCWRNHSPAGHCCQTSQFINEVFGWDAIAGLGHAWNKSPCNKILDLTVEQFGFKHSTRLVAPSIAYLVVDGSVFICYDQYDTKLKQCKRKTVSWLNEFSEDLENDSFVRRHIGACRQLLLSNIELAQC